MVIRNVRQILRERRRSPIARLRRAASPLVRRVMDRAVFGGSTGRFLLDYSLADTMTRATEAAFQDPRSVAAGGKGAYPWAFVGGSEAANWLGSGVMRILGDGAILIEGARTNKMPESDLNTWTLIGSATVSTDDATAPDADTNADTVTFTALATDAITHETTIDAGAGSDNDAAIVSCWLRSTSGTEEARIGLMDKDTTTRLLSADLTVTTTWTRFEFEVLDIGAGVVAPDGLIQNSTDAAARSIEVWGFQVEHDTLTNFKTSDIRTSGAAATRNIDIVSYADGTVLDSGAWSVGAVPNYDHAHLATSASKVIFSRGSVTSALYIRDQGGTPRVILAADGVVQVSRVVGAWLGGVRQSFLVDWGARELTIAGFPSGNGTFAFGSSENWSDLVGTALHVGSQNAGGGANFDGVIERPRAA